MARAGRDVSEVSNNIVNGFADGLNTAIDKVNSGGKNSNGTTAVKEIKIKVDTTDIEAASKSVSDFKNVIDSFDKGRSGRKNYFASQIKSFGAITDAVEGYNKALMSINGAGEKEMGAVVRNVNAYMAMGYDTESIKEYIGLAQELQNILAQKGSQKSRYQAGGMYSVEGFREFFDIIKQFKSSIPTEIFDGLFGEKLTKAQENAIKAAEDFEKLKKSFDPSYWDLDSKSIADKVLDTDVVKKRVQEITEEIQRLYEKLEGRKTPGGEDIKTFGSLLEELKHYTNGDIVKAFEDMGAAGVSTAKKLINAYTDLPSIILNNKKISGKMLTEVSENGVLNKATLREFKLDANKSIKSVEAAALQSLNYPTPEELARLNTLSERMGAVSDNATKAKNAMADLWKPSGNESLEILLEKYQQFGKALETMPKGTNPDVIKQYEQQLLAIQNAIKGLNELQPANGRIDDIEGSLRKLVDLDAPAKVSDVAKELRELATASQIEVKPEALNGKGVQELVKYFNELKQASADSEENTQVIAKAIANIMGIDPSGLERVVSLLREVGSVNNISGNIVNKKFNNLAKELNMDEAFRTLPSQTASIDTVISQYQRMVEVMNSIKPDDQFYREYQNRINVVEQFIQEYARLNDVSGNANVENALQTIQDRRAGIEETAQAVREVAEAESAVQQTSIDSSAEQTAKAVADSQRQVAQETENLNQKLNETAEAERKVAEVASETQQVVERQQSKSASALKKEIQAFLELKQNIDYSKLSIEELRDTVSQIDTFRSDQNIGKPSLAKLSSTLDSEVHKINQELYKKTIEQIYSSGFDKSEGFDALASKYREFLNGYRLLDERTPELDNMKNEIRDIILSLDELGGVDKNQINSLFEVFRRAKDLDAFKAKLIELGAVFKGTNTTEVATPLQEVDSAAQSASQSVEQAKQSIEQLYAVKEGDSLEHLLTMYRELDGIMKSLSPDDASFVQYENAFYAVGNAIDNIAANVNGEDLNRLLDSIINSDSPDIIHSVAAELNNLANAEQQVADAYTQTQQFSLDKYVLDGNQSLEQLLSMYRELGQVITNLPTGGAEYESAKETLTDIRYAITDLNELENLNITNEGFKKFLDEIVSSNTSDVIANTAKALRDLTSAEQEAVSEKPVDVGAEAIEATNSALDEAIKKVLEYENHSHNAVKSLKAEIDAIEELLKNPDLTSDQKSILNEKLGKVTTDKNIAVSRGILNKYSGLDGTQNLEDLLLRYQKFQNALDHLLNVKNTHSVKSGIIESLDDVRTAIINLSEIQSIPDNLKSKVGELINGLTGNNPKTIEDVASALRSLGESAKEVASTSTEQPIKAVDVTPATESIEDYRAELKRLIDLYYELEDAADPRLFLEQAKIIDQIYGLFEGSLSYNDITSSINPNKHRTADAAYGSFLANTTEQLSKLQEEQQKAAASGEPLTKEYENLANTLIEFDAGAASLEQILQKMVQLKEFMNTFSLSNELYDKLNDKYIRAQFAAEGLLSSKYNVSDDAIDSVNVKTVSQLVEEYSKLASIEIPKIPSIKELVGGTEQITEVISETTTAVDTVKKSLSDFSTENKSIEELVSHLYELNNGLANDSSLIDKIAEIRQAIILATSDNWANADFGLATDEILSSSKTVDEAISRLKELGIIHEQVAESAKKSAEIQAESSSVVVEAADQEKQGVEQSVASSIKEKETDEAQVASSEKAAAAEQAETQAINSNTAALVANADAQRQANEAKNQASGAVVTSDGTVVPQVADTTNVDIEARAKAIQEFTGAVDGYFTPLLAKLQEVNATITALTDLVNQAQTILNTGFESTALSSAIDIITQRKNDLIQLRAELSTTLSGAITATQPTQTQVTEATGQVAQTGNEFTTLKSQIDAVTEAVNKKNEALKGEQELVNTVVDAEKAKFGELETKLKQEVPLAVEAKNTAFRGEKNAVDEVVNAEIEKVKELSKVLVEGIPNALIGQNEAFTASAEHIKTTIEQEKLYLDEFIKKIEQVANNAKINIKVSASGVGESVREIDAKINELGLKEAVKSTEVAPNVNMDETARKIEIQNEFTAKQMAALEQLITLEQQLGARHIDTSYINPLIELLYASNNVGDLTRLQEEFEKLKNVFATAVPEEVIGQYEKAVNEYLKLQKQITQNTALGESMESTQKLADIQASLISDLETRFNNLQGLSEADRAKFGSITEHLTVEMKKLKGEFSTLNFDTAEKGFQSLTEAAEKYYTMLVTQASGKPLQSGYEEFNDLKQRFEDAANGLGVFADQSAEAKKAEKGLTDETARLAKAFKADVIGKLETLFGSMAPSDNRPKAYAEQLQLVRQAIDDLNNTQFSFADFGGLQNFYSTANKLQETMASISKIDYGAPGVSEFEFKDAAAGYDTLIKYAQEYYSLIMKQASGKNLTMNQATRLTELAQYYDMEAQKLGVFSEQTAAATLSQKRFNDELARVKGLASGDIWGNIENRLNNMQAIDTSSRPAEYFKQLEDLQRKLLELKGTINIDLNTDSLRKGYETVRNLDAEATKVDNIKFANFTAISKASNQMSEWMAKNSKAEAYFPQIKALQESLGRKGLTNIDVAQIVGKFNLIKKAAAETGSVGKSYIDKLAGSFASLSRYLLSYVSFYRIIGVIKKAINVVKELDSALMEIKKVSKESVETLEQFSKIESFDLAEKTATTAKQIQESTAAWLRLGKPFEEAQEAASASTWLLNVSEFTNIDDATTSLVAMKQAYDDLDYEDIIDKLNMVGDNFSSSTDQLAEGMKNVSAVLQIQGNSMDQALALLASANDTVQSMSKASMGVRTIALRIAGTEEAKQELEELGEEVDSFVVRTKSKTDSTIRNLTSVFSNDYKGVSVLNENGNLRSTYDILLDISRIYKEIQEEDKKFGTNKAQALLEVLAITACMRRNVYNKLYLIAGKALEPYTTIIRKLDYDGFKT